MSLEKQNIYDILVDNLSTESRWFLFALSKASTSLNKESLRDLANEQHKLATQGKTNNLIASRHSLDIHTARLEGAGLVEVTEIGRIRMYSITELGKELLKYLTIKSKQ